MIVPRTLHEQTLHAARAWTDGFLARRIAALEAESDTDVDGLVVLRALHEERARREVYGGNPDVDVSRARGAKS